MDCIFCKIIAGEIPNYTVYQDEHVLAFLDIQPRAKGHTVVIPRQHAPTIFDLDSVAEREIFASVHKTMSRLQDVLKPQGYSVGWNHGEAGGQVVPHLHIHIMPRWHDDGGGNMHTIINQPGDLPVEEVAKLFTYA